MRPITKSNGYITKVEVKVEVRVEPKVEPKIEAKTVPKVIPKVTQSTQTTDVCVFCKCNGETPRMYEQHPTKDQNGKVICPVLRRHVCECKSNMNTIK